jgi:hypothetical protein
MLTGMNGANEQVISVAEHPDCICEMLVSLFVGLLNMCNTSKLPVTNDRKI